MYQTQNIPLSENNAGTWENLGKLNPATRKAWIQKNLPQILESLHGLLPKEAPILENHDNPWNTIGYECINANLYVEAEQIYDLMYKKMKEMHLSPSFPSYYRGIAKFLQGRHKDAHEDFKLARLLDAKNHQPNSSAGRAITYMEETIFPTKEMILQNQQKVLKDLNSPRMLDRVMGPYKLRTIHKWNSSTPLFSRGISQGGGYFLTLKNQKGETKGIAIDPGYDFYDILKDLGLGVLDIDAIIITHDHDDHTESVEGILSLLAKYNDHNIQHKSHVIDIFGSAGAMLKFHGLLNATDPYGNKEVNFQLLVPGNSITHIGDASMEQKYGFIIHVKHAHHTERWTNQESAVGLIMQTILANKEGQMLQIGITGDSRYEQDIGKQYADVQLLLLNIGSIEKEEGKLLSQHLGICGCINLIKEARLGKPLLAILTEFGEEFAGKREIISKIIENWAKPMNSLKNGHNLRVIPADVHLEVRLTDMNVRESDTNVFFPYQSIFVDETNPEIIKYRYNA